MGESSSRKYWIAGIAVFLVVVIAIVVAVVLTVGKGGSGEMKMLHLDENKLCVAIDISIFPAVTDGEGKVTVAAGFESFMAGWKKVDTTLIGCVFLVDHRSSLSAEQVKMLMEDFGKKKIHVFYLSIDMKVNATMKMMEGYNGIVFMGDINKVEMKKLSEVSAAMKTPMDKETMGMFMFIQRNIMLLENNKDFKSKMEHIDKLVFKYPSGMMDMDLVEIINENGVLFTEMEVSHYHNQAFTDPSRRRAIDLFIAGLQSPGSMAYSLEGLLMFKELSAALNSFRADVPANVYNGIMHNPIKVKQTYGIDMLGHTMAELDDSKHIMLYRKAKKGSDAKYMKVTFHFTHDMAREIMPMNVPEGTMYDVFTFGAMAQLDMKVMKDQSIHLPMYSVALVKEPMVKESEKAN